MNYKYLDLFLENTFLLEDIVSIKSNNITIKFAALAATLSNKKLSKQSIENNLSLIDIKTEPNSIFKKETHLTLATLLSLTPASEDRLTYILELFDSLEMHFVSTNFLALTSELLCFYNEELHHGNTVEKIKYTYSLLKDRHWFLTGSEDIVTCALIVALYENIPLKVEEIEECYNYLKSIKFFPSNGLQMLSQILAFSHKHIDEKTLFAARLNDFLVNDNLFIKDRSLPLLGFAALLLDNSESFIPVFKEIDIALKSDTRFETFTLKEDLRYIISSCLALLTLSDESQSINKDKDSLIKVIITYVLTISTKETTSLGGKFANRILID